MCITQAWLSHADGAIPMAVKAVGGLPSTHIQAKTKQQNSDKNIKKIPVTQALLSHADGAIPMALYAVGGLPFRHVQANKQQQNSE